EANALAGKRRAAESKTTEASDTERLVKQNEEALERSKTQADRVAQRLESAVHKLREIEGQLAEARQREVAAFLRKGLRLGEACPVCSQPVVKRPPEVKTLALDALERQVQSACEAEAATRRLAEEAKEEVAGAKSALSGSQRGAVRANKQVKEGETELA